MIEHEDYNPEPNLFIPREQEQEYLAQHGIEIIELPNGSRLFGALRRIEDQATADISFNFKAGSQNERIGKRGGLHVMEHLIARESFFLSSKYSVIFNAHTSSKEFKITLNGTANPDARNYGIWPILPMIQREILGERDFNQEDLNAEIENAISEESLHNADPLEQSGNRVNEVLLSEEHPSRVNVGGEEYEVRSLTIDDMNSLREKTFSSDLLDVIFFVEGNKDTYEAVKQQLLNTVQGLDKKSDRFKEVDETTMDLLNPELNQGGVYLLDNGIRNKRVSLRYLWNLPVEVNTKPDIALDYFIKLLNSKLTEYTRRKGITYVANSESARLNKLVITQLSLELPNQIDNLEKYASDLFDNLKKDLIGGVGESDFEEFLEMSKISFEAVPPSVSSRFGTVLDFYKRTGRIVDYEKVLDLVRTLKPSDMEKHRQFLASVKPTTFIVGDLSNQNQDILT